MQGRRAEPPDDEQHEDEPELGGHSDQAEEGGGHEDAQAPDQAQADVFSERAEDGLCD